VRGLILAIALALLATVVGMRAVTLMEERAAALARAEASLRELSRVSEQYVRRVFETSEMALGGVAARVEELGGAATLRGNAEVHGWLRDLSGVMAGDYLLVVDARGLPVAMSGRHPAPQVDLSDRPWFRAHEAGEARHVGAALHSRITDEIVFTYSRALRRRDGALDGAAQVAVRAAFFQQPGLLGEMGGGTVLGLFRADGAVLARTGLTPDLLERRMPEALRHAANGGTTVVLAEDSFDGQERMVAVRHVPGWPLIVSASVPRAQVLAEWRRAVGWSVALVAAIGTVLLLATAQALRMTQREARTRVALAEANAALRRATAGLERRVEERTRALTAATEEIAERERRFRAIFDSTFQFMGLLSPDGTLLETNETALAFVGHRRETVIGQPFASEVWWHDPGERERVRAAIAAAAAGTPQRYQSFVRGAEGQVVAIDVSIRPIRDAGGHVVMLVTEGHDVTELKAAEARLREAQKTEMLGQLTGGVAHDFNNLLMAVLGNLSLLRKRLPEDPRALRLLDGAVQGAERGAALTQRLLAFARRQELRPVPVELPALVRGVAPLLERSAGPAMRVVLDLPEALPAAMADANQLELALLNLVVNARDAMPRGGAIRVSAREAEAPSVGAPAGLVPGRYLVLAVHDRGEGMDVATLSRATEPFFTTKGPGRGSGLGLSMVQGLAQQSGGGLALRSVPGEGTEAAVWLPRATEPAAAEPRPVRAVEAPPAEGSCRVLVVDDDPLVAQGTAMMLEDLGHRPVAATTAGEALARLAEDPGIELVLTDHAMPGMTGMELAERLRRDRPELPVALATGYADLPSGVAPWLPRLSKPYGQGELAALVARLTRRRAA
jgi:PAS domain S-box-containing protein